MFWDYFRWTREVEKGMECIGNRMPFSKKGKCFVIIRTAAARKRIAQVCKNSFRFKIFLYLKFSSKLNLNLILKIPFWRKMFSQTPFGHTNWLLTDYFSRILYFSFLDFHHHPTCPFLLAHSRIHIQGLQHPSPHQSPKQANSKDLYLVIEFVL